MSVCECGIGLVDTQCVESCLINLKEMSPVFIIQSEQSVVVNVVLVVILMLKSDGILL